MKKLTPVIAITLFALEIVAVPNNTGGAWNSILLDEDPNAPVDEIMLLDGDDANAPVDESVIVWFDDDPNPNAPVDESVIAWLDDDPNAPVDESL